MGGAVRGAFNLGSKLLKIADPIGGAIHEKIAQEVGLADKPGDFAPKEEDVASAPQDPALTPKPFRRPQAKPVTEQMALLDRRRSIASAIRRRSIASAGALGPGPDPLGAS